MEETSTKRSDTDPQRQSPPKKKFASKTTTPDQKSTSKPNLSFPQDHQGDGGVHNQLVSRAIEEVLSVPGPSENQAVVQAESNVVADDEPTEVEPFDVLVSLAQTMAVSQHDGNKLLMTLCYQAAPHFAKCKDEREKYTMAERLLTKMQNDLGTRFLWESSHLPTPMELAITATCILVDLMPTQHDVVFTHKGSLVPEHSGNEFFTMLCQAFLIRMDDVDNTVTLDFIVSEMSKLFPPGRFLLAHSSEFKFTPLDDDQLQCFLLRQILEEDRKNHPDRTGAPATSSVKKRRASLPYAEGSNTPELQALLKRKQKRAKLAEVTHEQYLKSTKQLPQQLDPSVDSETTERDDSTDCEHVETKKQQLREIVVGKRQSKPTPKVLAKQDQEEHKVVKTTKPRANAKPKAAASPKPKTATSPAKKAATTGKKPSKASPPTDSAFTKPKLVSKPKVILPTGGAARVVYPSKLVSKPKVILPKGGPRVIYPSTPPVAKQDTSPAKTMTTQPAIATTTATTTTPHADTTKSGTPGNVFHIDYSFQGWHSPRFQRS